MDGGDYFSLGELKRDSYLERCFYLYSLVYLVFKVARSGGKSWLILLRNVKK